MIVFVFGFITEISFALVKHYVMDEEEMNEISTCFLSTGKFTMKT